MKKTLFSKTNKAATIIVMAMMPFISRAQTVPNLYPIVVVAKAVKNYLEVQLLSDTTRKPLKRNACLRKENKKSNKPDPIFINHDKEIKNRLLKTWKY